VKLLISSAILYATSFLFNTVLQHPIVEFIFDGREKVVMYYNFSPRLVHIDIETKYPKVIMPEDRYDEPWASHESINIFFFPTDFTLMHTLGWRYIPLKET